MKESYEKVGVQGLSTPQSLICQQGGSAPKNQLVEVTLYKVFHQNQQYDKVYTSSHIYLCCTRW